MSILLHRQIEWAQGQAKRASPTSLHVTKGQREVGGLVLSQTRSKPQVLQSKYYRFDLIQPAPVQAHTGKNQILKLFGYNAKATHGWIKKDIRKENKQIHAARGFNLSIAIDVITHNMLIQ